MKRTRHSTVVVEDGAGWSYQVHTTVFDDAVDVDQDETFFLLWGHQSTLEAAVDHASRDVIRAQNFVELAAQHP